ncbi:MAG: hypothetical protein ACT4PE_10405 [Candidatus Eiseniibacteriota bacterium]
MAAAWAICVAGALVLAAPSVSASQPRHLGSIGVVCAPQRGSGAQAVTAQPEVRTPPQRLTVTLVVDLPCASTVDALQRLRDFHRSHPAVEIEILVLDPAAFARLDPAAAKAILTMELGVPLRWDPGRLRALAVRTVPLFRLEDPRGRVVTAFGVPSLDGMLGGLQ